MIEPGTAIDICRWLHDGALLLLWGMAAYVGTLLPRSLVAETVRRLGALPAMAAIVVLATMLAVLPLDAASLGDGWEDAVDPHILGAVLFDSSVGLAWLAQAIAGVLLLPAFFLRQRGRMMVLAIGAGLGLSVLALNGHASMDQGGRLIVHRGNDILHLLSAGAWLGALMPFLVVMRISGASEFHADGQVALRRFSAAGHVAVALVFATGLVNTGLTLGRWPVDWSSPYQLLLSIKIAVVCIMVGLAVANRYVFVPAMGRHRFAAVHAIRWASLAEILLGFAAIALVAVFGMLDPV